MSLATLPEAIEWAQARWDDRAVPLHLHERGVEPDSRLGAPRLSAAFLRWLSTGPFSRRQDALVHERCAHARIASYHRLTECPDCMGTGFIAKRREVYLYPMTAALHLLAKVPALRPHQPTPYAVVMVIAGHGWDWRAGARSQDLAPEMFEALALLSFRKLESRYRVGPPVRVGWTAKSESQQNAELAAS